MTNLVQGLFSRRLKRLRERNKITMVELAEAIGMSQATISEWEKGNKFPRAGALQQLAHYFDVPMEYFFKENAYPIAETVNIRCLPSISAGVLSLTDGIECDEIEFIKLPVSFLGEHSKDEDLIAFKVNGESMNLLFPDGSPIVALQIGRDKLENGDIAVYCFGNEYAVRRYRRIEQQQVIVLSPESTNKSFHDCIVPFKAESGLEIIAKIIWYGVSV
ncbi:XRE family transcriptional regulator [Sporosarcina sp. FSL K6-5500]|uniref:XRE family transcriptional regulator n=1 Tax=Sporosarcina sp. FSL K6-5500 TaxID=2921558 RepID=UPI0030F7417B